MRILLREHTEIDNSKNRIHPTHFTGQHYQQPNSTPLTHTFLIFLCSVGCEWLANVPKLKPEQISYVGLRDIDFGERELLKKLKIQAFTMYHVDKYGIGKVMEMILDRQNGRPLHASYDIDACDPVIAPSTGTRVRGGLSYREAHYVAESIAETGMLGSVDMVEVNPQLTESETSSNENDETVDLGLALVADLLGNRML